MAKFFAPLYCNSKHFEKPLPPNENPDTQSESSYIAAIAKKRSFCLHIKPCLSQPPNTYVTRQPEQGNTFVPRQLIYFIGIVCGAVDCELSALVANLLR